MGLRAARISFAALAAFCVLAVPVTASATPHKDDQAPKAKAKNEAKAEARPEKGKKAGAKPTAAPTTEPQPKSNADLNPGGANNGGDCGAYCSTRDGSPSQNGKGDGEAKGKPCAGCVGKADNKNPPGQQPDGTDHNAGYECDRNQGIGQTNPAHTGCQPAPAESPSPTQSPCVPTADEPCEEPECVPTADEPCEEPTPTPSVLPTVSEAPSTPPAVVKGVRIVRPRANPPTVAGGRLPTTGANVSVVLLLLVGLGFVAAGVGITVGSPARG